MADPSASSCVRLAHRGWGLPENTMPAFQAALDAGLAGCETDVRCSADGALVLVHDATLLGGGVVREMTRAAIAVALGHAVPTVDEVLAAWPDVLWNLEIKHADVVAPLTQRLRTHRGPVLVSCFQGEAAAGVGRDAGHPFAFLHASIAEDTVAAAAGAGAAGVVVPPAAATVPLAGALHQAGLGLGVYDITPAADLSALAPALRWRIEDPLP